MKEHFKEKKELLRVILGILLTILVNGYGLCITKEVMNNRNSLPKIEFFKSFVFGIKASIVIIIYTAVQFLVLTFVSLVFDFPFISIKEGEILLLNVGSLFTAHGSLETILFIVFVIITFYISTFFLEIALARLADKGKITSALNLYAIKRCLGTIGWGSYTLDYTKLILAIAILAYIKYGIDFVFIGNEVLDMLIGVLIFITEFIGIGMIYKVYKVKTSHLSRPRKKRNFKKKKKYKIKYRNNTKIIKNNQK